MSGGISVATRRFASENEQARVQPNRPLNPMQELVQWTPARDSNESSEDGLDDKDGERPAGKNVGHPVRIGTPTPMSRWRRMTTRTTRAGFDKTISVALFALAAAMLAFYLIVTYRSQFHSDAAMKLLLAEQMSRQFTLFPRDWNYVNDIPVIFPSLIAAPLSWFFAPSLELHSLVDVLSAGLVLFAAYVGSRAIGINGPLRLLAPTLLASGFSSQFAETVFGQSAYSGILFALFLLAGWGARYLEGSNRLPLGTRRSLLGVGILVLANVVGGVRGLASVAVPLLLASAAAYALGGVGRGDHRESAKRLGICTGVATITGSVVSLLLHELSHVHDFATAQAFSDTARITLHLQLLIQNWFVLFDALPPAGSSFRIAIAGIFAARMGIAVVCALLPVLLLLRIGSISSAKLRFLVLFQGFLMATTLYALLFTGVIGDEVHGVPRYLTPLVPVSLLIVVLWLQESARELAINATRVGWLWACTMLVLSPSQLLVPAFSAWPSVHSLRTNPRASIASALKSAGLTRGFATYWNANSISVLSGGDVRVASVNIANGTLPTASRYLSSEQWYADDWAPSSTFLLMNQAESAALNRPALDAQLGAPASILNIGQFVVLIYPFNLGQKLGFPAQPFVSLPKMTSATCAAEIVALETRMELPPNAFGTLHVRATNRSNMLWSQNSAGPFLPAIRLVASNNTAISEFRSSLPRAVKPGESLVLALPFRAAATTGDYTIYSSFVADGDAWCGDLARNWVKVPLSVKP